MTSPSLNVLDEMCDSARHKMVGHQIEGERQEIGCLSVSFEAAILGHETALEGFADAREERVVEGGILRILRIVAARAMSAATCA